MLDRAISTKFLTHRVSLQSSHPNFQKNFVSPKMAAILNFRIFVKNAKHRNAYISKTVLDRADYADFGCHTSIRLKAEHFLNTLALTFISFSGRFVFAVQKHYLFFCKRSSSYAFFSEHGFTPSSKIQTSRQYRYCHFNYLLVFGFLQAQFSETGAL